MKTPIRVTITGAAGNIGYALVFGLANSELLGSGQPVILQLLEIPPAMRALEGVAMMPPFWCRTDAVSRWAPLGMGDEGHSGYEGFASFALLRRRKT